MKIHTKFKNKNSKKIPIVFLHGDNQNKSVFEELEDFFVKEDYPVFSFDFPGHGNSDEFFIRHEKLLETLLELNKIQKPIIIANSSGGLVALSYSKQNEIHSLILINSPIFDLKKIHPQIDWNKVYKEMLDASRKNFIEKKFIDYSKLKNSSEDEIKITGMRYTSPLGLQNNQKLYALSHDSDPVLPEKPVLMIYSENEFESPIEIVREFSEKNKQTKLIFIEGTHNVLVTNPKKILKIISEELQFLFG